MSQPVLARPAAWRRLASAQEHEKRTRRRAAAKVRSAAAPLEPTDSARVAGLRYVCDTTTPGIRRLGAGKGVRYLRPDGKPLRDKAELQRIQSLVIPPAWTHVWICPYPNGHLQATGRDARGRKQYRYHPRWRMVRDEVKYGRLLAFAAALPAIRRRTEADLKRASLPREKVLAALVQLLERTLIRIGNEEYARQNGSIGLTTMRDSHARVKGEAVTFGFRGKSGIAHEIDLRDRRLARVVKACRDLPGYELFQYIDEQGQRQSIDSADVNAYLREISGEDFTAKDFRTWAGTVLAARELALAEPCESSTRLKKNVVQAIEHVAKRLGNTRAVSRKCYIHPAVIDAYMDGATIAMRKSGIARARALPSTSLTPEEAAVVALIDARLRRKTA